MKRNKPGQRKEHKVVSSFSFRLKSFNAIKYNNFIVLLQMSSHQVGGNDDLESRWLRYTSHRNMLLQHINGLKKDTDQTLCILGAGTCADFDLAALCRIFREVHLVDKDAESVRLGVAFQNAGELSGLTLHPPTDITGIDEALQKWTLHAPGKDEIAAVFEKIQFPVSLSLPHHGFDIVLSACVVSQLMFAARCCAISKEEQNRLLFNLRYQHLQLLLALTKPGGTALLVTDLMAYEDENDRRAIESCDLETHMLETIRAGRFFTGTNPVAILNEIRNKTELITQLESMKFIPPWLWKLAESRLYLVYALALQRNMLRM